MSDIVVLDIVNPCTSNSLDTSSTCHRSYFCHVVLDVSLNSFTLRSITTFTFCDVLVAIHTMSVFTFRELRRLFGNTAVEVSHTRALIGLYPVRLRPGFTIDFCCQICHFGFPWFSPIKRHHFSIKQISVFSLHLHINILCDQRNRLC